MGRWRVRLRGFAPLVARRSPLVAHRLPLAVERLLPPNTPSRGVALLACCAALAVGTGEKRRLALLGQGASLCKSSAPYESVDADLTWHLSNERSRAMAIQQVAANEQTEDRALLQCVETPANGSLLLAAVMDGHGGWQVADFVQRKLGSYVTREIELMSEEANRKLSEEELGLALRRAFLRLDATLMDHVKGAYDLRLSRNARVGACCVLAAVTDSAVLVANAGDCRAVLSGVEGDVPKLWSSNPHSADEAAERERLKRLHPGEDDVVVCKRTYEVERTPATVLDVPRAWLGSLGTELRLASCYVKGCLQPTRSFGDFYLKSENFIYDFEANRPFVRDPRSLPYISAEPEIHIFPRPKGPALLLLASDGVWDFLTPQEAMACARQGLADGVQAAADGVVEKVMEKASEKADMSMDEIQRLPARQRRRVHDDTTVCLVLLDQ